VLICHRSYFSLVTNVRYRLSVKHLFVSSKVGSGSGGWGTIWIWPKDPDSDRNPALEFLNKTSNPSFLESWDLRVNEFEDFFLVLLKQFSKESDVVRSENLCLASKIQRCQPPQNVIKSNTGNDLNNCTVFSFIYIIWGQT
jgi:hypothetical protein